MHDQTPLEKRKCQPCEGIGSPLNKDSATAQLANIPGWVIVEGGKGISKKYVAKNFIAAISFIQ